MRFFLWVFTLIAAIVAAVYFSDLNPDPITLRLSKQTSTDVTPTYLVLLCIAGGALTVVMLFGVREVRTLILNWRSTQRRKREEKLQSYYSSGVLAWLSRRTSEAITQLQKLLALDPLHTRALLLLGNIFRREKHYNEAIRFHLRARSLEESNLEILFSLARDLEDAKRYDEAIQALEGALKLDSTNPTALYRIRDIHIQNSRWQAAHAVQERLLKAGLSEHEVRAETQVMTGLKYEVGRQCLERGDLDLARRYFREATKLDKGFLPARIGFGELLIREGKLKHAAESWEKSYVTTGNTLFLQRLSRRSAGVERALPGLRTLEHAGPRAPFVRQRGPAPRERARARPAPTLSGRRLAVRACLDGLAFFPQISNNARVILSEVKNLMCQAVETLHFVQGDNFEESTRA